MRILWHQYFELFSLLVAIICARGLNNFSIGVLIPLLLMDNITEIIAINHANFGWQTNYFIYNIYLIFSTPLLIWLFTIMLDGNRLERRRMIWTGIVLEGFILLNYFFIQGTAEFNTYSELLIALTEIILSCLVLARLAIRRDDESGLLHDPYFWINAVTLLFSLVSLILLGSLKYIALNHIEIRHKNLYLAILPAANALLYTGYSYAFLLCQLQRTN
jgi:hypothetical protein